MAVSEYIKSAAKYIQRAAMKLDQEIHDLSMQRENEKRNISDTISNEESEKRRAEALAVAQAAEGDPQAAALTMQARNLGKDIDGQKRELDTIVKNIDDQIRAKQNAKQDLSSLSNSLQRKAGDPSLRT